MGFVKKLELNKNWKLCLIDDAEFSGVDCAEGAAWIPAQVPGDWPLDYVRAGLLEDPYYQDNYLKICDYENHHVVYSCVFDWDGAEENAWLNFEGIDTVADVYLNGKKIGSAENMYIAHEFEAEGIVRGKNTLTVHIKPVCLEARQYPIASHATTLKYNYEALVIRKATHMFGWDICPRIVSSGLWRPVSVIEKKTERIEDIHLWLERFDHDGKGLCLASFDVEIGRRNVKDYTLRLEGKCAESIFMTEQKLWYVHGRLSFNVENLQLWWPRGYGDANLYEIRATLMRSGVEVDSVEFKQGLRTAELVRDEIIDEDGNGDFCFVINKKRIYIKGTNWVPADAFHSNDMNRIPQILELIKDVGCNAIRIWGGGVYESDYFYDWCDENGMIIWQDFMMACGVYPLTRRMLTQLQEEATFIVRRLRRHASICLWAGDNECDQSYCWGTTPHDPTDNLLTRGVIPYVLRQEDLTRPYLPSSPYVSHRAYIEGKEQKTTEQHLWGPRDYFKGRFYHDANAVLASEMGYHGCNSPASIYRFIGREKSWPVDGNEMYLYHAASPELENSPYTYRIALMSSQVEYLFQKTPENLDEYALMSQISQAEAKKYFVERFRSQKGKRTGLFWWNIMDCWPQISDAVVDYYFCKKLAYHYIKRSQQPVCLMMDDTCGELLLYGVSDLHEEKQISYRVYDVSTGRTVMEGEKLLAADASTAIGAVPADTAPCFYAIEWKAEDGINGDNHYLHGTPKYDYEWYMECIRKMGYDRFEGFDNI